MKFKKGQKIINLHDNSIKTIEIVNLKNKSYAMKHSNGIVIGDYSSIYIEGNYKLLNSSLIKERLGVK